MRVSIARGAGLAGLVGVTTLDSAALGSEDAATFARLVGQSEVFELPDELPGNDVRPDALDVSVTVEDGDRRHTVSGPEVDLPSSLQALVSWIGSIPERRETVEPPGPTS